MKSNLNHQLKAFTMAEAILVMTVLGIIATIMITTLRPSEFQEKGLQILAKKVLSEIDTATSNVLFNDSADSTFDNLYEDGTTNLFTAPASSSGDRNASIKLVQLYKKYLVTTRKGDSDVMLYLKNGAVVTVAFYKDAPGIPTIFPGETNSTTMTCPYGFLIVDTNGTDGPNVKGKDSFHIPLGKTGIMYE